MKWTFVSQILPKVQKINFSKVGNRKQAKQNRQSHGEVNNKEQNTYVDISKSHAEQTDKICTYYFKTRVKDL